MAESNEQLAQPSASSQELTITLELVTPEDEFDPALLNVVGDATVMALQRDGYAVLPAAYTGEKGGGSFLVELVTTVQNISMAIWNNHAIIAEDIADVSGLIGIFTSIQAVVKRVQQAHGKQVGKEESTTHPIKLTVEIDGASMAVEAADLQQTEAALQLALKFQAEHPAIAAQVTTKSKVKVRAHMPARKRRRRR